jgi:hypothetical protein
MYRERSEIISFTKDDIERIVRHMAQQQIIGHLFIGKFGEQLVQWNNAGGVDVITKYAQGGWEDLPATETLALPEGKVKNKKKK